MSNSSTAELLKCGHTTPDPKDCVYCFAAWAAKNIVVPTQGQVNPKNVTCKHLGLPTGSTVKCPTCRGVVSLKLLKCAIHGTCTLGKRVAGHGCCDESCKERSPG